MNTNTRTQFNRFNTDDTELRSPFRSRGFVIGAILVGVIFLLGIIFTVLMFTGNLPFNYSYSVDYQFGENGSSYRESYIME